MVGHKTKKSNKVNIQILTANGAHGCHHVICCHSVISAEEVSACPRCNDSIGGRIGLQSTGNEDAVETLGLDTIGSVSAAFRALNKNQANVIRRF